MIKAVIFDVDGVLVDSLKANFHFFQDLMDKFGHGFMKLEEYSNYFHLHMRDVIKHSTKLDDEVEIDKIWQSGKNREVPYRHELLGSPEFLAETIKNMSESYSLGIATSRTKNYIFTMPHLESLEKYFKISVGYEDTQNHKPHPEPLLLAAEKLGFSPEECVYVGDAETDIIAAKSAGMKSILYSKEKLYGADFNFSSFQELPGIIKSL